MSGFDDAGVFFSDNFGAEDHDENQANLQAVKKKFKDFLREFHEGNFSYKYRDNLKRNYNLQKYYLEVLLEDVASYDEALMDCLYKKPSEHLPLFEEAAREVADEITPPRPEGETEVEDIQVCLISNANPSNIRDLKSEAVSHLVKVPGIIVAASGVRAKATRLSVQCRSCRTVIPNLAVRPGLEGYQLPRKCNTEQPGRPKCPLDPYFIMPDKCRCVDSQVLKMQELPESIPQGEMPRHLQLFCDRYLCERAVPGNRVTIIGLYSIKKTQGAKKQDKGKPGAGIRAPYLRVIGIQINNEGAGRTSTINFTQEEEEKFRALAASPDVVEKIAKSIAPSIYGFTNVKRAIACLLFAGSRKRMPDGLTRRGDINVLLLGDPGTAKSQLLKFVERVSPVAVYTSGKGSSAAGLTASVIRDPQSRNFIMEGGAMVLADGGVVCIDEFDKMREEDRVAIHEAMEQQTISIAKAGITTTLNSRCAVLAAANSIFGRWDELKGEENIDFMPTILSRFDMIFIVKDEHDPTRDMTLAKHVMGIHMNALQEKPPGEGELSLEFLKKYIAYCRSHCGPRVSEEAAEKLKNRYVLMRGGAREHENQSEKRLAIPITVRQLEAIIRVSESQAKMRLQPFATGEDVDEALRLFHVSTLEAATSGGLAGAEGFTTQEDHDMLVHIERQIKRRFAVGSQVSEHAVVQDFLKQKFPERAIYKVLHFMIRRGELQHRLQRKMLYRLK
ncbi:DNA replication licensing factor mcm5-like [Amphibalanus amphitrite]|uniref:DNA replication licensing factor mcm5-like n=1 Tax=Amphibalanus amphitrite TaxID=1232801 RepID=UPI001C9288A1|nr:DNA replication licensing factor mcm5-like [Amphibalanus amphitrite]